MVFYIFRRGRSEVLKALLLVVPLLTESVDRTAFDAMAAYSLREKEAVFAVIFVRSLCVRDLNAGHH
jgi:hypothetical protein